jgi:hypothetical protein
MIALSAKLAALGAFGFGDVPGRWRWLLEHGWAAVHAISSETRIRTGKA